MKSSCALVFLLCAACNSEVRLGAVAVGADGGNSETDAAIVPTSNAMLRLMAAVSAQCEGSLQGRETEFQTWTPSTMGFNEGPLQLTWVTETSLQVAGTPIEEAYQVPSIGLLPNVVPDQPEELLLGIVSITGSAPTGMIKDAALLTVNRNTLTSQSLDGQAGLLYTDAAMEGSCQLSVDLVIELQL